MAKQEVQKRDVVLEALAFRPPPYTPWATGVKGDEGHLWCCGAKTRANYGVAYVKCPGRMDFPVAGPLKRPEDLATFQWPKIYDDEAILETEGWRRNLCDHFCMFMLGGTLFELAWGLRTMEELLTDMAERPEFVEKLLDAIVAHRLEHIQQVLKLTNFDGIWFGDDYGMQKGLIMGAPCWRHFIKPRLAKIFAAVRNANKYVYLHSCGQVQGILDDLVEIGLNIFNPFQPEVMDVFALIPQYRGRLAFHGGMGVQSILPHGSVEDVRVMTRRLIAAGSQGGYIFSPSHTIGQDVPPENITAMVEELHAQEGWVASRP